MPWKEQMVPIVVAGAGLTLEGVWQTGDRRGAVIAPPHPSFGGSLEHPVISELAYALYKAGIASLRFNWRGVGASQGAITGDALAADQDYLAAVEQVHETTGAPVIAAGYSFGAATALRAGLRDPRVAELILIAPPVQMIESLALDEFRGPVHVIVGGRDAYAPLGPLSALLEGLPNANLDVIPKADHFFATHGLAELVELVRTSIS
ncbi:MAG: alpha/beta fold hydrolase [Myxococcota bacterium]